MPPVRPHVHSEDAVALLDFVLQWLKTEHDRTDKNPLRSVAPFARADRGMWEDFKFKGIQDTFKGWCAGYMNFQRVVFYLYADQ